MSLWLAVPLSLLFIFVVYRIGLRIMATFSRPIPEPPPPGELRRVKLNFRCSICGTEMRVTRAPSEDPEPPRCCMEEMLLLADDD